jgi:hypothetical protein
MIYPAIRIEGAILSPDIFEKLEDAAGQRPTDFGLEPSVRESGQKEEGRAG